MNRITLTMSAAIFVSAALAFISASAQQGSIDMAALLNEVQNNRQAIVAENFPLTAKDGAAFWPVYEEFRNELAPVIERRTQLIIEYRDNFDALDEQEARRLLDEYLDTEEDHLSLRLKYLDKFRSVLSDRQTLKYYQIENRLDTIIQYNLAQVLPLMP